MKKKLKIPLEFLTYSKIQNYLLVLRLREYLVLFNVQVFLKMCFPTKSVKSLVAVEADVLAIFV